MYKKKKSKGKENKFLLLSSLMTLMLLALALNVNAQGIECNITSASTLHTAGTNVVNVTYNASGTTGVVTAAIFASSSSTANSTSSLLANVSNASNRLHINYSLRSLAELSLEDAIDYSFSAVCYENVTEAGTVAATANDTTNTATSVTVDRTIPQAPTALSPSGRQTNSRDVAFSATVNGANTTGCALEFERTNPGSSSYAMTHSTNSCTLTLLSVPDQVYRYNIRATDGTNTTLSATEQIQVDVPTNTNVRGGIGAAIAQGKVKVVPDKAGGLQIASATPAGERSQGLQNAIDRTNANFQKELTKEELKKTGTGAGIGAAVGAGVGIIGFAAGPLGIITVPVGASLGALIGGMLGASR